MHRAMIAAAAAASVLVFPAAYAQAEKFTAKFSGFEEVGALGAGETGAILSGGTGTLDLDLNTNTSSLSFTLTYSGLSSDVTQSHIHFGKRRVAGGIMVFFCSNLANGPAGTQPCPINGGTVTGTIMPTSIVGPTGQNVTPGDFNALVEALRSHTAYGNIHTTKFPAGEIRGQVRPKRDKDDHHDNDRGDDDHRGGH